MLWVWTLSHPHRPLQARGIMFATFWIRINSSPSSTASSRRICSIGFYMFEIHGAGIPMDALRITDARHAELMNGQAAGQIITAGADGAPVLADLPPQPPPTIDAVRSECVRRMAAIVSQYSPEERETWPIQVAEAQAVLAGETEAMMLVPLAAARGLPLAVFAGAVVQAANATKAATAKLLAAQARMLVLPEIPSDITADKWWD